MKILLVSHYGDAADWLFRMGLDDNKVQIYIEDETSQETFDGLLHKCKDWRRGVQWADLILFDDNRCDPSIWKYSRSLNKPCVGGSPFAAKLENDRAYAHSLMGLAGMPALESRTFKTGQEVIAHLKQDKKAHVIKPQGGDKVHSHHLIVGEEDDGSDAIGQVERLIDLKLPINAWEVEERKRGVEVALSIFFNGRERVGPIFINFEHKHSHEKEKGFLTGEQGTLGRYVEDSELPLYEDTLAKFLPTLRASGYIGIIDINLIVGRNRDTQEIEISPLEFTPRPGKPTIFLMDELQISPWANVMMGLAKGEKPEMQVHFDWCVGVLKCAFGFPFEDQATEISKGIEIRGLDEHSLEHIHPMEVKLDKRGRFVHAGGEGYVLVATGRGESIGIAKDRAYQHLSNIKLPNGFHREDISDKINTYELEDLGILPREEMAVS